MSKNAREVLEWLHSNKDLAESDPARYEKAKELYQRKKQQEEQVGLPAADSKQPGFGSIAAGMGAEIGIGAVGKYGGMGIGATIGSAVPIVGTAIGASVGYGVGAMSSGIMGSIAAQKIEGRETISWGRAISAGLINLIPGTEVSKAAIKSGKVIKEAVKIGAKEGLYTGVGEAQLTSIIDKGELASFEDTATYGVLGAGMGAGLGGGIKALVKKSRGKTPDQIDESVAHNDITKDEIVDATLPKDGSDKITVFRGGDENPNSEVIYTTKDKDQAQGYAEGKGETDNIKTYEVDPNKLASEDEVLTTLKDLGYDTDEGMLHELLDPNFKDEGFYLGDKANKDLISKLKEKGYEGYIGRGVNIKKAGSSFNVDEVVLLKGKPTDAPTVPKDTDGRNSVESQVKEQVERSRSNFITGNSADVIRNNESPSTGWLTKIYKALPPSTRQFIAKSIPSVVTGRRIADVGTSFDQMIKSTESIAGKIDYAIKQKIKRDPNVEQKINDFLDGGEMDPSLKDIEGALTVYRNTLNEQQDILIQLLDDDMIRGMSREEQLSLAEKIQASRNNGNYVTREYRLFTDRNFKIDNDKYEKAVKEVQRNMELSQDVSKSNRTNTAANARKYVDNLIAKGAATRDVEPAGGFRQAVDKTLKVRHLDPEADKALMDMMGVIKEPGERARGTLTSISRMVARSQAENEIEEILLATGLGFNKFRPGLIKLTTRSGKRDVFVEPETQLSINQLYAGNALPQMTDGITDSINKIINTGVGSSKASKVLFNLPSYAVQVWGNATTLMQLGFNPFSPAAMNSGFRIQGSDFNFFSKRLSKEMLEQIKEAEKYGIKGVNVLESDIRDNMERGFKFVDNVIDPFAKAYAIPDTMFRYVGWMKTQEALRKIYKNADPEDIKKAAALLINDTYQNYSKLNKGLRSATRYGVMPQFASFTAEFARNQYYQGKHILKLMKGTYADDLGINLGTADVGAMKREGAKRMAATAFVFGTTFAAQKGIETAHGVSQEMKNAFVESAVPDYDKNSSLIVTAENDGKNYGYMNLSYVAPQAIIMQAFTQGLDGSDATNVTSMLTQELIGEGSFFAKELLEGAFNMDLETGKKMSVKEDNFLNYRERAADTIVDLFQPGTVREVNKLKKAMRGTGDYSVSEVIQRQIGRRVNKGNLDEAFTRVASSTYENAAYSKAKMRSILKYGGDRGMTQKEMDNDYPALNENYRTSMQVLVQHNKNYEIWGRSEEERIAILKDAGVSSKDILFVLDGEVPNLEKTISGSTAEKIDEFGFDLKDASKKNTDYIYKKIKSIYGDDPREVKTLMNYVGRKLKKRNLSARESLLYGLSSRNQIEYLQSRGLSNNRAYLRKLVEKGVIKRTTFEELQ